MDRKLTDLALYRAGWGDNSIELVDGWRGEPYFWGNRSLHETSGTRRTMCCCLPTTATRSTAAWFRRPCFTG